MNDRDKLVRKLADQGVLDSQGNFRMRSAEGLRKLRDSPIGDPYNYALALYRAMVSSGARTINVTWDLDELCWDFDGPGLPTIEKLRFQMPSASPAHYLQVGLLGALSREPLYIRYRGPDGGWELRSVEQSITPLPHRRGTPQLQLRRRPGKTLLWRIGRVFMRESRELDIMRERCSALEIDLSFKGQPILEPLNLVESWEVYSPDVPRLRLTTIPQTLSLTDSAPFPLHAVFAPVLGEGRLVIYVSGARLAPAVLPWANCHIALSLHDLELDLSQQSVVKSAVYEGLLKWLHAGWLAVVRELAQTPRWLGLVACEILRKESPLREEMKDLPLFEKRSLRDLTQRFTPVGLLPPEQEIALFRYGAKFINDELTRLLKEFPELRGEMLLELFRHHGLQWTFPAAIDCLPQAAAVVLRPKVAYLPNTLGLQQTLVPWGPGPEPRVQNFARHLFSSLSAVQVLPDNPLQLQTAYLESALLLPEAEKLLARSTPLGTALLPGGCTLSGLFQHFITEGELALRDPTVKGQGFSVPREIGERIALGFRGKSVTWNGKFCHNPMAANDFALLPHVWRCVDSWTAGLSGATEEAGGLRVPLYSPEGYILIDTKNFRITGKLDATSLQISDGLTALGRVRQEVPGEDKTHIFHTLAFSDGLRNYYLKERGKRYDSPIYSDSDTEKEVSDGAHKVLLALEKIRTRRARSHGWGM